MSGRITQAALSRQTLASILERQRAVEDTRERIASGQRILSASEDPAATERLVRLRQSEAEFTQFDANGARVAERLTIAEETLANVTDVLQRVRELSISAANAGLTDVDRRAIATELEGAQATLMDLANTRDPDGQALFAGTLGDAQPFTRLGGTVRYGGDEGVRRVRVGPDATVADAINGADVFLRARAGNGTFVTDAVATNSGTGVIDGGTVVSAFVRDDYRIEFFDGASGLEWRVLDGGGAQVATGPYESGGAIEFAGARVIVSGEPAPTDAFEVAPAGPLGVFEAVDALIDVVRRSVDGTAESVLRDGDLAAAQRDVDAVFSHVLDVRATIGARSQLVDVQRDVVGDLLLGARGAISELADVDIVEAVVTLEARATSLEAAQRAFARLQGLSLFRFLS